MFNLHLSILDPTAVLEMYLYSTAQVSASSTSTAQDRYQLLVLYKNKYCTGTSTS